VVREVRCILSRRLTVSNVLDSLISAGNSFQMVEVEKVKERLLKLVVQGMMMMTTMMFYIPVKPTLHSQR